MDLSKKIGIVISPISFFSNSFAQNAYFLYKVFENGGFSCELLSFNSDFSKIDYKDIPIKTINPSLNLTCYSYIISVGNGLTKEIYDSCRAKGIKVFGYVCGNNLPMNLSDFISDTSKSSIITKSHPLDKLWLIESFSFMKTYIELMHDAEVMCVPHLWSPCLIEDALFSKFKKPVDLINYKIKTGKKINILILEPNLDFVKTALIPIMAAEKLNKLMPELIAEVYVFNFPEKSTGAHTIINNLTVRSKMRIFTSQHIAAVLTHFNSMNDMPIIVSHQILTPLNYLYYELMCYSYPFVHNSTLLKDFGYFYNEYDIDECCNQIIKAFNVHNSTYEKTRNINRKYLESIDPDNKDTIKRWSQYIEPEKQVFTKTLQIIVITVNEVRKKRIQTMFSDLKIPYDLTFFEGYTPKTSTEYLNYYNEKLPEPNNLICCSRSHNAAVHEFATKLTTKDIVLILEDDVVFIKKGFVDELEHVLRIWEKHPEIDFVNIGYLFKESKSLKSDGVLHWDLREQEGTLWGAQGYLIKRTVAEEMAQVIYQPTAKDLYNALSNHLYSVNKGVFHTPKALYLSPDHYLSVLWRQGYVNPMLCMEDPTLKSTVWYDKHNSSRCATIPSWVRSTNEFYSFESPRLEIIE